MAGICVRLGFWQLARREQRQAMNERIAARIQAPPVPVATLRGDTVENRFRQVIVTGTPDYEREFALTIRGNNGSPGADIITPIRIAGSDSAVLVNRGWVYAPDGMTVDFSRWREIDSTFVGYVDSFEAAPSDSVRNRGIRRMSHEAIRRALPYPIKPFYVVAMGDTIGSATSVVRLRPPRLGEGPHLSYAFQWFGFATIALVGGGIVAARSMR